MTHSDSPTPADEVVSTHCYKCGAERSEAARFCPSCGAASRAYRARHRAKISGEHREDTKRARSLGFLFVGVLVGTAIPWFVFENEVVALSVAFVIDLVLGGIVVASLGRPAFRMAIGRLMPTLQWSWAIPATAISLAAAWGWIALLQAGVQPEVGPFEGNIESGVEELAPWIWIVAAIVFAPIAEEWLCRGAMWSAIRPVTTRWTAIIVTAVLFAFLHGFNGGFVLELPHRFIGGCAFGYVRAKTGSLAPCILAHAMHNAIAVWTA